MLNKEIRGQPHRQLRKESLQRKSFTPNYGSVNRLFPLMNNVECSICHNFRHVAARCRSRMFQANNYLIERSSASRYFKGYCFSCNLFGHKAIDCYRRNMKHIRCYACNKFGHIAKECKDNSMDRRRQYGKKSNKHIYIIKSGKDESTKNQEKED